MKKVLTIAILFVMVALVATTAVNATTSAELSAKLLSIGSAYGMTSAEKVKIDRYLADYPVTDAQADQVVAKAEAAAQIMKDAGVTDVSKLTAAQKDQLKTLANDAASIVGVTLVFKTSSVEIYKDGKLIETVTSTNGKLAYTGNEVNAGLVVSAIAVVALAAGFVVKKRVANA